MPATEQTWRNNRVMHVIFAVTGILMLVCTVWMLLDDHSREWKGYQRKSNAADVWFTQHQSNQILTQDYYEKHEDLRTRLALVRGTAPDPDLIAEFKAIAADKSPQFPPPPTLVELGVDLTGELARLEEASAALKNQEGQVVYTAIAARESAAEAQSKADQAAALVVRNQQTLAEMEKEVEDAEKAVTKARQGAKTDEEKQAADDMAEAVAASKKQIGTTKASIEQAIEDHAAARAAALEAAAASRTADEQVGAARDRLFEVMGDIIRQIQVREDNVTAIRKFNSANYDAARSKYDLAVAHGASEDELKGLQSQVDAAKQQVDELIAMIEQLNARRMALDRVRLELTGKENELKKRVADHEADLNRLSTQVSERSDNLGKRLMELPILDAFNTSADMEIKQIWLPDMTINFNFSQVARFDRCITCHRSIDKSKLGEPTTPAYLNQQRITVSLPTPATPPQVNPLEGEGQFFATLLTDDQREAVKEFQQQKNDDPQATTSNPVVIRAQLILRMLAAYGMQVEQGGPLDTQEVAITLAWREKPAAAAGLRLGDVIETINGGPPHTLDDALRMLGENVEWGKPIQLVVRRGLPHPFATHPRLDLFGSSVSPHAFEQIGCTICHDGQGGGTSFQYAEHTPNNPDQERMWKNEYGWFSNHHWPFPMAPHRFVESNCLKCHHDVTELEPSERFPEPPAPKLVAGYHLIRQNGCFGCHEIVGYDGPDKRVGPDLRLEPNYAPAALQLLTFLPARLEELQAQAKPLADQVASAGQARDALAEQDSTLRREARDLREKTDAASNQRKTEIEAQRQQLEAQLAQADGKLEEFSSQSSAVQSRIAEVQEVSKLAEEVVARPDHSPPRERLFNLLTTDSVRPTDQRSVGEAADKLAPLLASSDTPGQFRRVGPSLRYVAKKLNMPFLLSWIANPTDFRPTTRMPRFFGLHSHFAQPVSQAEAAQIAQETPSGQRRTSLEIAEAFEPVEIRGIAEYLLASSQERFQLVDNPYQGSAERGKQAFELAGCLACHTHKDFPGGHADQGPDLSRIGDKLNTETGEKWLYTWLLDPSSYHARTKMPILFLEQEETTADGVKTNKAADISAFLLASGDGWKPSGADAGPASELSAAFKANLDELAAIHLAKTLRNQTLAGRFIKDNSIPPQYESALRGDEVALKGLDPANAVEKKLRYIGRKTINRYGCSACHDIPGYEDAKPIGTGLAEWGRKNITQLDYAQIAQYLQRGGHATAGDSHTHRQPPTAEETAAEEYYLPGLVDHYHPRRESFLWQKLREPRGYDYMKTANKPYLDWLRMPQFNFTEPQRQQIMTFVLGLVAEPPASKYVYSPTPRQKAINEGNRVLAKFNCNGCHIVRMPEYELTFKPGQFTGDEAFKNFEFLKPHFTEEQLEASAKRDPAGNLHARIVGMPLLDITTGDVQWFDPDGGPLERANEENLPVWYKLLVFKPVLIDGKPRYVSQQPLAVPAAQLREVGQLAWGGDFARLAFPKVLPGRQGVETVEKAVAAWGWLPPPLIGEGHKVQTDWVHDFLLEPHVIRPATVLRMPKFNLSSDDATKVANYFAATDNAQYPYPADPRRRTPYLEQREQQYEARLGADLAARETANAEFYSHGHEVRLGDAFRTVLDSNYCVKCHLIGDFAPQSDVSNYAPNLADVYRRMRPEYVRNWIAYPQGILPYTLMPQNFALGTPAAQTLYVGDSADQIEGITDFLMNYDRYMESRTNVKQFVKPPPPAAAAAAGAEEE